MQDRRCRFGLGARIERVRRRQSGQSLREIAELAPAGDPSDGRSADRSPLAQAACAPLRRRRNDEPAVAVRLGCAETQHAAALGGNDPIGQPRLSERSSG